MLVQCWYVSAAMLRHHKRGIAWLPAYGCPLSWSFEGKERKVKSWHSLHGLSSQCSENYQAALYPSLWLLTLFSSFTKHVFYFEGVLKHCFWFSVFDVSPLRTIFYPLPLPSFHTFTYSHAHKATVMSVNWNKNGNWLLTASRDHLIKVYDIRAMKEMYTLKGHKKDVNSKELRTTLRDALFENNKSYVSKTVWSCSQILSLSLE